jgi:hypothetical protein
MRRILLFALVCACAAPAVVSAGYVNLQAESGIISTEYLSVFNAGEVFYVLTITGEYWSCRRMYPGEWHQEEPPLPVSVEDIEWWEIKALVTRKGEFWMVPEGSGTWTQIDFPGTLEVPVASRATGALAVGNHPNPSQSSTSVTIRAEEPITGARIVIFDAHGREVRRIPIGDVEPIEMAVAWDGRDDAGVQLPAGVYLYRLVHDGGASEAAKAVILR